MDHVAGRLARQLGLGAALVLVLGVVLLDVVFVTTGAEALAEDCNFRERFCQIQRSYRIIA